jgi:hypothetical protein
MYWGLGVGSPTRIWRGDLLSYNSQVELSILIPFIFPKAPTLQQEPFLPGNSWTADLTVDSLTKKVYWTETSLCGGCFGSIWRADPIGANVQLLASPKFAHDVALDEVHGKMYWTDNGLYRSNLDGTNPELLVNGAQTFAFRATIDTLFYAIGKTIYQANRDGANAAAILTSEFDIDDLTFGAGAVVPEPPSVLLCVLGCLLVKHRWRLGSSTQLRF